MSNFPQTSDALIIGAGVAGLSTAMQLAMRGQKVIVLERDGIGGGSTSRAAGLLGQLRGTAEHTRMLIDAVQIVKELETRAGVEIFVQTGSLRIAETPERVQEIKDLVEMGKAIGFNIDHLPIPEVARLLPYMKTDDLLNACYCPTDGHLQPAELASAYLKVGRSLGVRYHTQCPVQGILTAGGRATGVRTPLGEFHAPVIVNAAGPWTYLVAGLAQASIPTAAIGHYYLTTRPDPKIPIDRLSPAIRNRHHRIYTRPESGGLIVGIYEAEPVEYDMEKLPPDFDMSAMKAARDSLNVALLIDAAHQRFPWLTERTPMTITTGIMTFTPDGKSLCGRLPDLDGFYHCSCCSGHGIMQSPIIGKVMADLILDGRTNYDIDFIRADRFLDLPGYQERADIKAKCYAMYASYYGRVEGKRAAAKSA
ncbi:MAG: FAD-binding oxidoreductase [Verrucomicrobia bacterium]|nr:FAD-binding oxidoreductase [Verrucomicrobiota bacterium]